MQDLVADHLRAQVDEVLSQVAEFERTNSFKPLEAEDKEWEVLSIPCPLLKGAPRACTKQLAWLFLDQ